MPKAVACLRHWDASSFDPVANPARSQIAYIIFGHWYGRTEMIECTVESCFFYAYLSGQQQQ